MYVSVRFTTAAPIDLPTVGLYGVEPGVELELDEPVALDLIAQGKAVAVSDGPEPDPVGLPDATPDDVEPAPRSRTRTKG